MFKLDPLPQWSDRISFSYNRGIPIISVGIHQYNYNTEMLVSAYYTLSGLLSVSHSLLTTPLNSLWGCHCYSSSRMRGQGHRWLKWLVQGMASIPPDSELRPMQKHLWGMLTPSPNDCWLWFLGLLLTDVVLKDKMKRKAYLTTINWHGQQRPLQEVGASAGLWGVGWFCVVYLKRCRRTS